MARAGIRRTHTGCITCKTRRVKCDETHPSCQRCLASGWQCGGYQAWVPKALRRIQPSTIPGAGACDMRALDFFRRMVGPSLPGPLHNSFWTKLIPQMTHTENAVRHATIAISYLYEEIHHSTLSMIDNPREKLVLPHYDMAIQQAIILSQQGNLDLIHICTILFSDIELLQGNPRGALLHSRHGAGIFKSSQDNLGIGSLGIARSYQLFDEHLSGHHATTEDISSEPRLLLPSGGFSSLEQAHQSFASLVAKSWPLLAAFALGKSTSEHLSQHNSTTSPSMMHRAERAVHLDLDLWANSLLSSKDLLGLQDTGYKLQSLKINWLTVRIRMTSSLWDTAANTSDGEGFQELMRHYQSLWGKNVEAMRYVVVSQSSYSM